MINVLLAIVLCGYALAGSLGCNSSETSPHISSASKSKNVKNQIIEKIREDPMSAFKALMMPHQDIARLIGAHRLQGSSKLLVSVPDSPEKKVFQKIQIVVDKKGNFSALKNTSPQHGYEAIFDNGWLYFRLRYSRFIKHRPAGGELKAITNRTYSLLPAYLDLLKPFILIEPIKNKTLLNREAIRFQLKLNPSPAPLHVDGRKIKKWRKDIVVQSLVGDAVVDEHTGVPLKVFLKAQWSFNPPLGTLDGSGIPKEIDKHQVGKMKLTFSQEVLAIGNIKPIAPPEDILIRAPIRRTRLEIERQFLTGERSTVPWK